MPRSRKRAAAAVAEDKIKQSISAWNEDDDEDSLDMKSTVCHLSDFEDLGNQKKIARSSKKNKTKALPRSRKDGTVKDDRARKPPAKKNFSKKQSGMDPVSSNESDSKSSSTSPSSDSTGLFDDSSVEESKKQKAPATAEIVRRARQAAAAARQQHSNGPMILSRRMSYKLSDPSHSPVFSPITAVRLLFSPTPQKNSVHKTSNKRSKKTKKRKSRSTTKAV